MASKQPSRMVENNNNNSSIVFQEENLPDLLTKQPPPPPPPPPSNNYLNNLQSEQRYFSNQPSEFRRNVYDNPSIHHHHHHRDTHNNNNNPDWNHHDGSTDGSDCDEEDDDDDDVDDDEERDGDVEEFVTMNGNNNGKNDNSNGSVHSTSDKLRCEKPGDSLQKHHPLLVLKDGNGFRNANNSRGNSSDHQHYLQGRGNNNSNNDNNNQYENQVTLAEPDLYYSQYMQGRERSAHGQKEIGENGCGVSGGKEVCLSVDSGEPLRAILSDPITGTLMDDAMILPCGHSFGNGGLQHVIRMKACYTCSQSVTEDSVSPNLSLRSAIEAFRREEELHSSRASKRKRERLEQEKSSCGDLSMYFSRGKGVQFPFAVTDRVIIKGNKRTPLRFVGREAVVTTQCLNGWYVVKTLDNAESVKLQYRSLAKVPDTPSSSNIIMSSSANKTTTTTTNAPPNWL